MAAAGVGSNSGNLIIPPGYRFQPTDDIALGYLKRKILGKELRSLIFPTADVYGTAPHRLPFENRGNLMPYEWYFYTTRPSHELVTGDGYWTRQEDTEINVNGKIQGFKQELIYYKGALGSCYRTPWRIWEYRMNPQSINAPEKHDDDVKEKIANFVFCKVFLETHNESETESTSD